MMHSNQSLYDELHRTLVQIDKQIENVKEAAEEMEISWLAYSRPNGTRPATELLIARTHCLQAMAALKTSEDNTKGPRR